LKKISDVVLIGPAQTHWQLLLFSALSAPTNHPFDYCSITTGSFVEEITILSDVILSEKQEGDWMSGRAAET
jgi:hypothetical protein